MTQHMSSLSSWSSSSLFEGSATASRAGAICRPYENNVPPDEASRALESSGWVDDGDGSGEGGERGGEESHCRGDAIGRTSRGIKPDAVTTSVNVEFASMR